MPSETGILDMNRVTWEMLDRNSVPSVHKMTIPDDGSLHATKGYTRFGLQVSCNAINNYTRSFTRHVNLNRVRSTVKRQVSNR